MVPSNGIVSMYTKIMGEQSLLALTQSNLLSNLDRIAKVRTHTYLAFNGQTEHGISRNFGCDRYYSWEDTIIDCRNAPNLVDSDYLNNWEDMIIENSRFAKFKESMESKMGGHITIEPFFTVLRGQDNMRYNIKRQSKIEDFDTVRVGIRLQARDEATFKAGLNALKEAENPFKIKTRVMDGGSLQMA